MIQSISASASLSASSRPALEPDAKAKVLAAAIQKAGSDSADFSSQALKALASESDGG